MFFKNKDGFKPGELERICDRISVKQERDRKKHSGLNDEQYGTLILKRER